MRLNNKSSTSPWAIATALLAALYFLLSLRWAHLDASPPRWDESFYLLQAATFYKHLTVNGVFAFLHNVFNYDPGRVVLVPVIVQPAFLLWGPSLDAATATLNLFWFVLAWAIFGIAKLAFPANGDRAGFFALLLFGCYRLTTDLTNYFLVDFALAALVCATQFTLLKFYSSKERRWLWLTGLFLSLGMLTKVSFPAFVISIGVLAVFELKQSRSLLVTLKMVYPIGVAPLIIAGPYYFYNIRVLLEMTAWLSSSQLSKFYGFGPVLDIGTITAYWYGVFADPAAIVAVVGALIAALVFLARERISRLLSNYLFWVFASWFVVPFLMGTFGPIKDPRYVYPSLVPLFILAGYAVSRLAHYTIGVPAVAALFALPITQYVAANGVTAANALVLPAGGAQPPDGRDWQVEPTVLAIADALDRRGLKRDVLFLGGNRYYHLNLFRYYGLIHSKEITYTALPYYAHPNQTLPEALEFLRQAPYSAVLYKSGENFPEFSSRLDSAIVAALKRDPHFVAEDLGIQQPDGSRFTLLIGHRPSLVKIDRIQALSELTQGERFVSRAQVGELELLGVTGRRVDGLLRLNVYWRSLREQKLIYTNFIHLLDEQGNIFRTLDRPQDLAMSQVRKDDIWRDTIEINAPDLGRTKTIGMGLYLPQKENSALPVKNALTDWDGKRLLIRIPQT